MKIGLALGGGSLRGAAHIGILKVLLDNGIVPDIIAGTSAGSIVASLYACGMKPLQIEKWATLVTGQAHNYEEIALQSLNVRSRWSFVPKLPMGLINGRVIESMITRATSKKKFKDLQTPAAVVATDLSTGQGVVYTVPWLKPVEEIPNFVYEHSVPVAEAVRASIAIPGIFTPKALAGRLLVDGGLVDNVPADVLKSLGADFVIAVDLGFRVDHEAPFKNMIEIILQTTQIMGQRVSDAVLEQYADVVLHPRTGSASLWDFHKIPHMIQTGVEEASRRLPEIQAALRKHRQ